MLLIIVFGLLGLGIVVFVHELGHFLIAKAVHIEVEAFAIGMGPKLAGVVHGGTEYRINALPIGGYCRMKGEHEFKQAIDQRLPSFPYSEGSLFSVSPFKRILTYLAGPAFNVLFAIVLFALVWSIGYEYQTFSNKIIIGSDYPSVYGVSEQISPAEAAGLSTGDQIISIDERPVAHFSDLQEILIGRSGDTIPIEFIHEGRTVRSEISPELNKKTGAGVIGIAAWIDPVIDTIPDDSLLLSSELAPGDRIISINDRPVAHAIDLFSYLQSYSGHSSYTLTVERNSSRTSFEVPMEYSNEGQPVFNAGFAPLTVRTPDYSAVEAFSKGISETWNTFTLAFHSISLIFQGLDLSESLSGPLKITYLVGNAASQSFSFGFLTGITTVFQLLAFISVALGFANLLPIPALDGGQIMVSIAEIILHKEISPQSYYRLQIIGFGILVTIMVLTLFNDVRYFIR
ncbi:MAG: site-2 protease family protein [Spirochaetia bacterium]|nr:site-2 protease family protein [Spirochaetia bacterium]MCF7940154.1 site-2 protease family protein [Spirochaetia bacterium]